MIHVELGEPITVMAHACPTWLGNYRMNLAACGRLIAMGRDPFNATAQRLVEEGVHRDTALTVRFEDGRLMIQGIVKDGIEPAPVSRGKTKG